MIGHVKWKAVKAIKFFSEHRIKIILQHSKMDEKSLYPKNEFMGRDDLNNGDRLHDLYIETGASYGDLVDMKEIVALNIKNREREHRRQNPKSKRQKSKRLDKLFGDIERERKSA